MLKDDLDAIDIATQEAAAPNYRDAMVVVYQGQWTKGKTILEGYPDVKDGRGRITEGGGGTVIFTYKTIAEETGRRPQDISTWVALARQYPEKWQAEKWARKKADEVTERYLGRATRGYIGTTTPQLPSGKYHVLYADPPWNLSDNRKEGMEHREHSYPCMDTQSICELKIIDLRADPSVLFLWATSPMIEDAFRVLNAWGFQYKAQFIWDKVKHNMGHYNSVRHELLLICTKGSYLPEINELYDSVVSIERSDTHSEKPQRFREIIDELYPSGNRIALFFDDKSKFTERWTLWGVARILKAI